jgi:hypothetical protein
MSTTVGSGPVPSLDICHRHSFGWIQPSGDHRACVGAQDQHLVDRRDAEGPVVVQLDERLATIALANDRIEARMINASSLMSSWGRTVDPKHNPVHFILGSRDPASFGGAARGCCRSGADSDPGSPRCSLTKGDEGEPARLILAESISRRLWQ